ncbi:unnamed protein product [Symbiodinium natans]|uniref:Uncharacterized protein n=1 Tax=Symbiodinium natans TaxID=878477 RepID=A0A812U9H4_9DINO|nr:unnamed protein product [Symbiodinium natans]
MRIARAAPQLTEERFTAVSILAKPRPLKPRKQDSNDSGSVWQVVFRQMDPIDPQRGPFAPIWEVPLPRAKEEVADADRSEAGILPRGDLSLGLWRPPEGVRRLPCPWEKASLNASCGMAPPRGNGVRRDRKVSTTPPACRPKMGGHARWKRLAEPRHPGVSAEASESRSNVPTPGRTRPGKAALKYCEAGQQR